MKELVVALIALIACFALVAGLTHLADDDCKEKCGARPHVIKGRESYCFCQDTLADGSKRWVFEP
jgi:hypothetical protein